MEIYKWKWMVLGALGCINNADLVNIYIARLIDHEETWKYTNGSGWF